MLRRTLTFLTFIGLVAGVSAMVYFNSGETSFRYSPDRQVTLPLGVLMVAAAIVGMLAMFLLLLLREGRHAVQEWRIQRGIRTAERTAALRAEARSLSLAGDFGRARSLFSKATKIRNPDVSDLIDFAETYLLEGNPREAKRILENGQKDFGNDPLLLSELARASRMAGDDAAAASVLERALAVYPRSQPLLRSLRDVLVDSAAWPRAVDIQERIVQLRPDDAAELNRLYGIRYEAAMRLPNDERVAALRALTSANYDFTPAVLGQARALVEQNDLYRAIKLLEKSVRRHPRGVLLDELERICKDDDAARLGKTYMKLASAFPASTTIRARAVRFMTRNGRTEQAVEILGNLPTSDDGPAVLDAAAGSLYDATSRLPDAVAAYRRYVERTAPLFPPWRCSRCAALADAWSVRCRQCGAWGTIDDI